MTAITITVVLLVAYFSATNAAKAREQAGAGTGPDGKKKKPSIPSIEELGVQPTDAEAEALLASEAAGRVGAAMSSSPSTGGWAFWGQGAPQAATNGLQGGKRIGSEGEDE